jgi:hypothetical protein
VRAAGKILRNPNCRITSEVVLPERFYSSSSFNWIIHRSVQTGGHGGGFMSTSLWQICCMIRSVTINVLNFQINLLSRACSNREHNNFTEVVLGLPQVPMMVLALLSNVLNSEPFFLLAVWSFFLTLFFFWWYFWCFFDYECSCHVSTVVLSLISKVFKHILLVLQKR